MLLGGSAFSSLLMELTRSNLSHLISKGLPSVRLTIGLTSELIDILRWGMTPKSERNKGKRWSESDVQKLRDLAAGNTPTRVIGLKLGRTEAAVRSKAAEEDVSLKPTNQSPYNRQK